MPVPSGLVSTSTSPAQAPALVSTRSGCTSPITTRPKSGSSDVDRVPAEHEAARALRDLGRARQHLAQHLDGSFSRGQPTRLSAKSGVPPMA